MMNFRIDVGPIRESYINYKIIQGDVQWSM